MARPEYEILRWGSVCKRFAWLPRKIEGGGWRWLRPVWIGYEPCVTTMFGSVVTGLRYRGACRCARCLRAERENSYPSYTLRSRDSAVAVLQREAANWPEFIREMAEVRHAS